MLLRQGGGPGGRRGGPPQGAGGGYGRGGGYQDQALQHFAGRRNGTCRNEYQFLENCSLIAIRVGPGEGARRPPVEEELREPTPEVFTFVVVERLANTCI